MKSGIACLAFAAAMALPAGAALAQVTYAPYAYPYGYGYPAPGGVFQPDETGSGSLSFDLLPTPEPYPPAVRVVSRCQYPDGWNATDFNRDLNGTPAGLDHTCRVVRFRHHGGY